MTEIYDFASGLNFTSWSKQFDQFHDWVMQEIRVIADDDSGSTQQHYSAKLVLADPYRRFDIAKVCIGFEDVETLSFNGLSSLNSELSGLLFERTQKGVRLASSSENQLLIEARRLTVSLAGC